VPTTASNVFADSYDENGIFAIAVEKYRRTGIRQRSAIPAACIDPTTMRPRIVDAVLASPMNSDRVAEAYEFRRRLKELPEELRVRVDGKLDRFFRDTAGTQHAFELSEPEEQSVSFKRIVRLVVARMKPYYDAGRITKTMFKALAELVSKNFSFHTYDPSNFYTFYPRLPPQSNRSQLQALCLFSHCITRIPPTIIRRCMNRLL
jgi:hypothetical protein